MNEGRATGEGGIKAEKRRSVAFMNVECWRLSPMKCAHSRMYGWSALGTLGQG